MGEYSFELFFKNDNVISKIEEPFMFDAFTHGIERKKNNWAVDSHLFAENSDLEFTNGYYSPCVGYHDIDGIIRVNLSHELDRLIDAYETYGPDADISFRIYLDGVLFEECYLDLEAVDTDLKSYFKCSCIENTKRSKHKIREDDVMINIYSDKDLDGGAITQLVPNKILLKSKPTLKKSKWIKTDIPYSGAPNGVTNKFPAGQFIYFNFCRNPIIYGINDTLTPSPFSDYNNVGDTYNGNLKMIDSKTTKNNINIKVTSDISITHKYNGRTGYLNQSSLTLYCRVSYDVGFSDNVTYQLYSVGFTGVTTQNANVPNEINFTLPTALREGEFLTMWWEYHWTGSTVALTADYNAIENYSHIHFNDCSIDINAVETTINSVVQGIRWIDLLKKSAEIISGLPVDAPMIDVSGEYYNTMVLNGGGMRNIDSIPFNVKAKDAFETGEMVALDYQICKNDIKIGSYEDFYSNRLLWSFNVSPDEKFNWDTNKEYRIKTFDYIFKNYEQDRAEESTLDAVHTEAQFLLPNPKTKNPRKVQVNQILDVYKIDSLRKLGINPETKDSSLSNDTDMVFLSVEPVTTTLYEIYTGRLYISKTVTGIKIVSTTFRWDKIGLGLSSTFQITSGTNIGTYQITLIESTLLTLTKISGAANTTISEIVTIRYSLFGVNFISRTNEGFDKIEGVIAPTNYGNLIYSIKRNMRDWLPFLATCSMRFITSLITNSFFKSNSKLITRLSTETIDVVDEAAIIVADIASRKKLTDRVFNINVYPEDPTNISTIFTEIEARNPDGSIGGYFEFLNNSGEVIKGYPNKLDYIVKENKIEATCSEKYEEDYFEIVNADRALYSFYTMFDIYVKIYKADDTVLFRAKRFTKIKINGVVYTDMNQFVNDLELFFSI